MQKVKQKKMRRRKQLKLQVSKSPYCLPYSSCDVSLENLVWSESFIKIMRIREMIAKLRCFDY